MNYQLYEIMLLFAIYSILGWIGAGIISSVHGGGFSNRGLCKGPFMPVFGIGALIVLFCGGHAASATEEKFSLRIDAGGVDFVVAFLLGIVCCFILGLFSRIFLNGLSGERIVQVRWYHYILSGFSALALVFHINPIVVAVIRHINPWIHMIFLLLFWSKLVSDWVDGLADLIKRRKERNNSPGLRIR